MKKKVLDVTNEKCPMTFLKAKIFIADNKGSEKMILIKGKKDFQLLKNNLEKNFEVKSKKNFSECFPTNFYLRFNFMRLASNSLSLNL